MLAGSALGASAGEDTDHASTQTGAAPVSDRASAKRADRSQDRAAAPAATPTAEPAATPEATASPEPTATPTPTPTETGFPAVPGCDATVPEEGTVANGQLADDELCPIGDGESLRADAAAAFLVLQDAYEAEFGEPICITDSYRSLSAQERVYATKPHLAAAPGTSEHGWGLAVDLGCGVESFGTATHEWMLSTGKDFGWTNPDWARPGGSRPEPWHWEFEPSLVD